MSPMRVEIDSRHGGRWVSLVGPDGKEWLWRRPGTARDDVAPGDPFVDAGGLEECYPTIGGVPDHGEVWSRAWQEDGHTMRVTGPGFELRRDVTVETGRLTAAYRLQGDPGHRFIWAAHALLELSDRARVELPEGIPMIVDLPDRSESCGWPYLGDIDVSRFGPDDGSVMGVRIPDVTTTEVVDGGSRLTMTLDVQDQPFGLMLWRNLGGWPDSGPYRSTGVEPMIGHRATLANAGPGQAGVVPDSGEVTWTLRMSAT
ncbi:hypothetical protein ACFWY5_54695 [Nonomuraea sp. NPDC059007]|uniref:hypothetical protein n=1 Tax=Nonomuraea sp. NPDC059007 TaxID=3346692 RepID=UPI00368AB580